jgi:hypothetical protein
MYLINKKLKNIFFLKVNGMENFGILNVREAVIFLNKKIN